VRIGVPLKLYFTFQLMSVEAVWCRRGPLAEFDELKAAELVFVSVAVWASGTNHKTIFEGCSWCR